MRNEKHSKHQSDLQKQTLKQEKFECTQRKNSGRSTKNIRSVLTPKVRQLIYPKDLVLY